MVKYGLVFFLCLQGHLCQEPLVLLSSVKTSSFQPCCRTRDLLSCQDASVSSSLFQSRQDLTLPGSSGPLSFKNIVNPHGHHYTNQEGDQATITLNPNTGNMFGSLHTAEGLVFGLEKCADGHIWKQYDVANFKPDEGVDLGPDERQASPEELAEDWEMIERAAKDNTTMASYSIMFYYTPSFEKITDDIEGFVDQVLAETNQGYINSMVPIEAQKFCVQRATLDDTPSHEDTFNAFKVMKGTGKAGYRRLRKTADAASLLVESFSSCGVASLNVISSGRTLSACQKSCALGYFSFGHEVGHNIGLHHNPEVATNTAYSYGHGHLIDSGYRTILAYSTPENKIRKNYYSNPVVDYPGTGTPTGVSGLSNNAAVLMRNRFRMSAIGDESGVCADLTATTLAPTSPIPVPVTVNKVPFLRTLKTIKKVKNTNICRNSCKELADNYFYKFKTNKNVNKRLCSCLGFGWKKGNGFTSAELEQRLADIASIYKCSEPNKSPVLKRSKTLKKVGSPSDCYSACSAKSWCSHFKWRTTNICYLMRVVMKKQKGFHSGQTTGGTC